MKKIFLFFVVVNTLTAYAQTSEHISSFNMMSFSYRAKNWMAYLELQSRGIEHFFKFDYYEVKGGVGYTIHKQHQPFIGIGRYTSYKDAKFYQEELRIWLQYIFSHRWGKLKIDHRGRAEKRFFHLPQENLSSNTERYRYRLSLTLPMNKPKVSAKTLFLNAFEEIFLGPALPVFKRNRSFAGAGYQFNDFLVANLGYIWQREFFSSGPRNLHFLYLGLNFTFSSRSKTSDEPTYNMPVAE